MRIVLSEDQRFLEVDFGVPQRTLSWAVIGGGLGTHRRVIWHFVRREELDLHTDPVELFRGRLAQRDCSDAVGLLTARYLAPYAQAAVDVAGVTALTVATVGLGNALCVGDPVRGPEPVGTINILCHVSVPLSDAALLEAMSLVVEARTAALLAFEVKSTVSEALATGTGTDCVVVACPKEPEPAIYSGKHTAIGSAIGRSVLLAMRAATERWLVDEGRVKVRPE